MKQLLFILLFVPLLGYGQFSISGKVFSNENQPLSGAHVWIEGTYSGTYTGAEGDFRLTKLKAGEFWLSAAFLGFARQTILISIIGKDTVVHFSLEPEAVMSDEILITATRAGKTNPGTFANVSKEELEALNLGQDLPFLLDQTPSVVVTSDAGAGVGYTGIRIRGSDPTRINVTFNGIPVNDSESHGVWWVNTPDLVSSTDNIQIQRGVGSSTNGAGAFGATINLMTTQLKPEAYGEITAGLGSFNTRRINTQFGTGLIREQWSFDVRLSYIGSDGYVDRATSDLRSAYISGGYQGSKTIVKGVFFKGKEGTYQAWYGVPEPKLTGDSIALQDYISGLWMSDEETENLFNSGRTYNYYTYQNEVDNYGQDHYQLHFTRQIQKAVSLQLSGFYTRGAGYFEQWKPNHRLSNYGLGPQIIGGDTITRTDIIRRRWLDNHFFGATYGFHFHNFSKSELTIGGALSRYLGEHFGEIIWASHAVNFGSGHRYYENDAQKTDFNVFAKWNRIIGKKANLYIDIQYRLVDYATAGVDNDLSLFDVSEQFHFFNPKAGFNYRLSNRDRIYLFAGIGNREPVRNDFIDAPTSENPKPETMINTEAGYEFSKDRFTLLANIYLMYYFNQLALTGAVNDVGAPIRTNVDRSYRAGLELVGSFQMHRKLLLSGNLTLSRNRIQNFKETVLVYDANFRESKEIIFHGNTDLSYSPAIIGAITLDYRPWTGVSFLLMNKYIGRQFLDNSSSEDRMLKPWFTSNFKVEYALKNLFFNEVRLGLLVNNLWNVQYSSNGYTFGWAEAEADGTINRRSFNFLFPQAGINFLASLTVRF